MLVPRQRGAFPGGAAGHKKIDAGIDLTPDETAQRRFVQRAIDAKRSHQRGAATCKHTCHLLTEQHLAELMTALFSLNPLRGAPGTAGETFPAPRRVAQRDGIGSTVKHDLMGARMHACPI